MIDESTALEQLNRLSEYDGFHALKREAFRDLLHAIQVADTPEIAKLVIDEIKAESTTLPLSSHIRRRMYEENERNTPDPVLEEHERWKAEAAADAHPLEHMQSGSGIWKKGKFPDLDRHLELMQMRIRLKDRMPPDLLAEYRALTQWLKHVDDVEKKGQERAWPAMTLKRAQ